ncbi:MAG: hypothetical protein EAZ81_13340 [Verrucomicrobia bacterium]|nr:MAG: hypothetical protein EAZ81_13340 [Verrucomicrobiota bacterium]
MSSRLRVRPKSKIQHSKSNIPIPPRGGGVPASQPILSQKKHRSSPSTNHNPKKAPAAETTALPVSPPSSLLRVLAPSCETQIQNSTFNIQHSTFNIQHSTFNIQNSKFKIQNSKFKNSSPSPIFIPHSS